MNTIYKITVIPTGEVYIGKTKRFNVRVLQHLGHLRRCTHSNVMLQQRFQEYGEKALKFEVLEEVDDKEANKRERAIIKAQDQRLCLNVVHLMAWNKNEQHKRNLAESLRRHWRLRTHEERVKQMEAARAALAEKGCTEEHRANLSKAITGRPLGKDECKNKSIARKKYLKNRSEEEAKVVSTKIKEAVNNPEVKEKHRQALIAWHAKRRLLQP